MSLNLLEISWNNLQKIDKERAALIIGIAPIEEHGAHLPLGVDIYETNHWIEKSIEKLERFFKEFTFIKMPIIPFGYASFESFVGNMYLPQKMLYELSYNVIRNIADWGFKNIIVLSGHADPKHLIAIEQACDKINKKYGEICISPMGAIFSGEKVGIMNKQTALVEEKLLKYPNDFHAGWIETSTMQEIKPELVDNCYNDLPDIEVEPHEMIFPNKVNKKIRGKGYLGYPNHASKELGKDLNENMSELICEASIAFIKRGDYQKYKHHFLYKMPFLKVRKGFI